MRVEYVYMFLMKLRIDIRYQVITLIPVYTVNTCKPLVNTCVNTHVNTCINTRFTICFVCVCVYLCVCFCVYRESERELVGARGRERGRIRGFGFGD